jgi:hypothetical protein
MTAAVNISLLPPIPDNTTIAALAVVKGFINRVIPGLTTTAVNFTYPVSSLITLSITGTLTNTTVLGVEAIFQAIQFWSFSYFSSAPTIITSVNVTNTCASPTPTFPVCTVAQAYSAYPVCPPDQNICINQNGQALCACNFPYTVRLTGTLSCVPNPCYAGVGDSNGGCGGANICLPNFGATANRTCSN